MMQSSSKVNPSILRQPDPSAAVNIEGASEVLPLPLAACEADGSAASAHAMFEGPAVPSSAPGAFSEATDWDSGVARLCTVAAFA